MVSLYVLCNPRRTSAPRTWQKDGENDDSADQFSIAKSPDECILGSPTSLLQLPPCSFQDDVRFADRAPNYRCTSNNTGRAADATSGS
jgi:hypothetical protein